jgi:hypothetical protein
MIQINLTQFYTVEFAHHFCEVYYLKVYVTKVEITPATRTRTCVPLIHVLRQNACNLSTSDIDVVS